MSGKLGGQKNKKWLGGRRVGSLETDLNFFGCAKTCPWNARQGLTAKFEDGLASDVGFRAYPFRSWGGWAHTASLLQCALYMSLSLSLYLFRSVCLSLCIILYI